MDYPGVENKCPVKIGKKVLGWENYYPPATGTIISWHTKGSELVARKI
jgi:hypothetical protein